MTFNPFIIRYKKLPLLFVAGPILSADSDIDLTTIGFVFAFIRRAERFALPLDVTRPGIVRVSRSSCIVVNPVSAISVYIERVSRRDFPAISSIGLRNALVLTCWQTRAS